MYSQNQAEFSLVICHPEQTRDTMWAELTQMNKIYVEKSKDLGNDQWKINFMNEHIDTVHKIAERGLSPKESKDILWFLASDWSF